MDFTHRIEDGVCVLELSGNLIGEHDGMPLTDAFNEIMEDGVYNFVIDLSGLKHINSTGLGVFITLLTRSRKRGGELALVNPSGYIKNLLLITKLNSIFSVYETSSEAVRALKNS